MSDNLKQLTADVDTVIPIGGGVASVKTVNHNPFEKVIIEKVGKKTGFPFVAAKEPTAGIVLSGFFYWNNTAMNTTTPFQISVGKNTIDGNDIGEVFSRLTENSLIHFKDHVGRSTTIKFISYIPDTDAGDNDYYLLTASGFATNTDYAYQDGEEESCMLEFVSASKQSVHSNTYTATQDLIDSDLLIVGDLYNITDADPDLYGGTSIFLTAITTSKLSLSGQGIFYTPKYDLSDEKTGYNIWTRQMEGDYFTAISGVFEVDEQVTANNGATAIYLAEGFLNYISGNWGAATSITGDLSGATANITGFTSPSYAVDDVRHWGGLSWKNLNGNVGDSVDKYTLDSEWEVLPVNGNNYNIHIDEIEFKFENNMIVYRKDKYNNVVSGSYQSFVEFASPDGYDFGNPIKDFQWGCMQDNFNTTDYFYLGFQGNEVTDSYFGTLNSRAWYMWHNVLKSQSYIQNNKTEKGTYIFACYLDEGSNIQGNNMSHSALMESNKLFKSNITENIMSQNATLAFNQLDNGDIINNVMRLNCLIGSNVVRQSSQIGNNKLSGSQIAMNHLIMGSSIAFNEGFDYVIINNNISDFSQLNNNEISTGSEIASNSLSLNSIISNNVLFQSQMRRNQLAAQSSISDNNLNDASVIEHNNLFSGNISTNTIDSNSNIANNQIINDATLNLSASGTLTTKSIQKLTINHVDVVFPDISAATLIFDPSYSKDVFKRQDGTLRLSYINNSDALVVTAVTT